LDNPFPACPFCCLRSIKDFAEFFNFALKSRKILKYTTVITWSIIALLGVLGGWVCLAEYYLESLFPLYPLIDTKLPPGFSEAKFASIQMGMTKTEVLKILPAPVPRREYDEEGSLSDIDWHYGQDGACLFGDFAWFEFTISFNDEGKVSGKYSEMHRN
jgi:hypothetical protein